MQNHRFLSAIMLVSMLLLGSWLLLVFETNGAYTYYFFIAIVFGSWFWGRMGGMVTGVVAWVTAGPFMPHSLHPYRHQSPWEWWNHLCVFVVLGLLVGHHFQRLNQKNREIDDHTKALQEFGSQGIHALAHTMALWDSYRNDHCQRVAQLSRTIGQRMGLSEEESLYVYWSALVHDLGKIGIQENILNKAGPLSQYEYDIVKEHPIRGDWILSELNFGHQIRDGVLTHHERWDGTGYPSGLKDESIPLQGRIIAVADVWDTITNDRPYRNKLPQEQCLVIMLERRGTHFDPAVLDVFLTVVSGQQPDAIALDYTSSFLDFRGEPNRSPYVWCIYCKQLCSKRGDTYTMTTAYRPMKTGIYPCGICDAHCDSKTSELI